MCIKGIKRVIIRIKATGNKPALQKNGASSNRIPDKANNRAQNRITIGIIIANHPKEAGNKWIGPVKTGAGVAAITITTSVQVLVEEVMEVTAAVAVEVVVAQDVDENAAHIAHFCVTTREINLRLRNRVRSNC